MRPSRKTSAAPPPAPGWHALEVPVPDASGLVRQAGGLPGRAAPRASRVVESLGAALDGLAATAGSMWLVAPSRRVGQQWVETLVRLGQPVRGLHVTTISALAFDLVADTLAERGCVLAPDRAKLVIVEQVLGESRAELPSLADVTGPLGRLAERVLASLEALRLAGLRPEDVARGLGGSRKARDLAFVLGRYEAALARLNLVDQAAELSLAIARVQAGRLPQAFTHLLLPDDLECRPLEDALLAALDRAPGLTVRRLAADPPLPPPPAAIDAGAFTLFRAAGEANEVRHVLRTCLARGLALDEIEIVHTDRETYPALVRELVAALPRPESDTDEPAGPDQPPVTFADGLPLGDSKPGRALAGWLAWRRDGHPQAGLERLLRDGVFDLARLLPDPPRAAALVRQLRSVKIGRGLGRTASLLDQALARAVDQPPEAFAGHDDDGGDEAGSPEELAARKARITGRLGALVALVGELVACEGKGPPTVATVLAGARRFVESLAAADSELDGNARRLLLDEIDAMLAWRGAAGGATARDMLDWLERLPRELVVLGSGPQPGRLHVSGLAGGGHSGRPYTFVLGLDERRFPGGAPGDPLLTDGDRSQLNAVCPAAKLAVSRDASQRAVEQWRRLLARLGGHVWLGFSCRDPADDGEVFPSPALVALFGQMQGRPLATVADLLASLPPPETFVPADPALALDDSQWWLATLGPLATAAAVGSALAAHRGHLRHGAAARAARSGPDFTPFDGLVPAAGPVLDPRADHGRTASPHSLETLGACPRRFFFRYGLGVEPLERFDEDADRWLAPKDAGSLLHTVLERFMRGLIARGELPSVALHLADLLGILDEELEAGRRRQPPLTELAFEARRDELRTAMHTFLHDEERSCRETGSRPLALEAAIGVAPAAGGTPFDSSEPVSVALAPGETIRLRGRIDRIDVRPAAAPAYTLWDYKSGSGSAFPAAAADDPFNGGRTLQHGLYVVMLRARLADPACGGGEVERFGYFFPTRAGKGRRLEWSAEQLAACTAVVRQLAEIARQGVYLPSRDPDDCARCDFLAVCGDPARTTRAAARMIAASEPLRDLLGGLHRDRPPRMEPEIRRPRDLPLDLVPHPAPPPAPPDEPVRARIRTDLATTLLVEAAAGTGKTTCMVERMLALVRTGQARPEGIVAVTFTKKAADELRWRFREKLQAAATAAADPAEQARYAAALERIDSMVIGTIHSFAGRLLRERPLEAGVDPGFRELDESADRLLRRQAWREFVSAAPADHPQLLAELARVGLRLGDLADVFIDRFATYGDVEAWPAPAVDPPDVAAIMQAVAAFVARIEAAEFPPPADRGSDELMNALELFARMARRCDASSVVAVMDLVAELDRAPKVTQGSWPGTGTTPAEVREARKAVATGWEEAWATLRETVAVPALWQWRAHRYPVVIAALRAALAAYDRLRAERGGLSFQDLLSKAARLLAGEAEVRRSFRSRYTHLLVDEFQDTDPVQAEMLLLLTASDPRETDWRKCVPVPGSLFVVGDPKQSLYRFRRADIVTYSAVRDIIAAHGDVLSLTTNFRSRSDLVAWTNDVFGGEFPPQATAESPAFTPSTSGRQEPPLDPAAGPAGWLSGLRTLRFVRSGSPGRVWAEREARELAAFIRAAVDGGLAVPRTAAEAAAGRSPACRPGDFLIVTRERKHLGVYAAALAAAGLPVDVTGTLGEEQAEPLRDLRTCLAALADPDDPVAMLALMRGTAFGFSDAELFDYRQAGGRFGGPIDVPPTLAAPLAGRFAAARATFARWRQWQRHLPVAAVVERMLDDAGLLLVAALADGEAGPRGRAVAGLLVKYLERLRTDRADVASLHDALDLLDDMIAGDSRAEFDPLSIDVPSADRVRIMNLHKAKGLEAPVVFLADFQRRKTDTAIGNGPTLHIDRSGRQTTGWLAATQPLGWAKRIVAAPEGWPALFEREQAFEAAERIRLDYVSATRAGSCLVVSLFERRDAGTKTRPESFVADGAWDRFASALADAADLPEVAPPRAAPPPAAPPGPPPGDAIRARFAASLPATFARISPRELLTEPAEGLRYTGAGLGEAWGRAIHRLLELAASHPDLDLPAAAATVLSSEDVSDEHRDRAMAIVRDVLASDVWRRASASGERFVEVPFAVQVEAAGLPDRVRADAGRPLPTIVRGVIDLVFREADGSWTVVDWKTDAVTKASVSLLEEHYRPQVELYAHCWRLLSPDTSAHRL